MAAPALGVGPLQRDGLQRVQPADPEVQPVAVTRSVAKAVEDPTEQRHGLRDEWPGLPVLEAALVDGADQLLEDRPGDGVEPCLDHDVRDLRLPNEPATRGSLPGQLRDEELDGAVRAALSELAAGAHERVALRGAGARGTGGAPPCAAPEPSVLARRVLLRERRRQ